MIIIECHRTPFLKKNTKLSAPIQLVNKGVPETATANFSLRELLGFELTYELGVC